MNNYIVSVISGILFIVTAVVDAAPYQELTPGFDRKKSTVMIRKITSPMLSSLDYAAYIDNPVLYEPEKFKPRTPEKAITVNAVTFGGLLSTPVSDLSATPLTKDELEHPLAWRPLVKRIWGVVKDQRFADITSRINGYKWNDPSVSMAYQEISAAWLHRENDKWDIWVEIEFRPWVHFISDAVDSDHDGIGEIYGKLDCSSISPGSLDSVVNWIQTEYVTKVLSREEVTDWITELASYWYPSKNTDILDHQDIWPDATTEPAITKSLHGVRVSNPIAVVRGKPFGKAIYNVYCIEGMRNDTAEKPGASPIAMASNRPIIVDTSYTGHMQRTLDYLADEKRPFSSYTQWAQRLFNYKSAQEQFLSSLPTNQMGYEGKNSWLFFRKDLEYAVAGDLKGQPYEKDPIAHLIELKKFLDAHGVGLIFVPVPNKTEVYFENLPFSMPSDRSTIINPYSRKVVADILEAGIDVVDLLPTFLKNKAADSAEILYQKQDTHWTSTGLNIAADCIAQRIQSFSWYNELAKSKIPYVVRDTVTLRLGDIVDRLPEEKRSSYPPVLLKASRVYNPDTTPFKSDKDALVILIGDSFTGVFESVDCKSAGVGAAIAAKTGIPIDIITSWGGGPMVRERLVRQRLQSLGSKKLIIYMMVERDLFNYEQGWSKLDKSLSK
jgi:hypothetical protein